MQPSDGVQFLSQLAQFSGLEQSIQLNQEVQSVRQAVETLTNIVKQNIQQGEPTA
jgi:flagellar hook assembly protein FlgD